MSCKECEHSPKTYEEYCIGQRNPSIYCPDAYTEKSHLCNNYRKEDTPQESKEEIMELVIKVSKELYNRFGHEYSDENLISKYTNDAILEAFCNGTPLPKKLIDGDKLIDSLKGIERLHIDDELRSNILNAVYGNIIEINKEKREVEE